MTNIRNSFQVSKTLVFRDSLCAKGKSGVVLHLSLSLGNLWAQSYSKYMHHSYEHFFREKT